MLCLAKNVYVTQKHVIQRENVFANTKTYYWTWKRITQRKKRELIQRKTELSNAKTCYPMQTMCLNLKRNRLIKRENVLSNAETGYATKKQKKYYI